jgi:plasmid maintenance system antidote protein VapI
LVVNVNTFLSNELGEWVSQSEAARLRGISRQAIARLVVRGRLSTIEVAGRKLVRRSEVMAFDPLPAGRKPKG